MAIDKRATKKDILESWYRQVWERGDLDAIDLLFAPGARAGGIVPGMQIGAEEFRTLVLAIGELIAPPRVRVEKTVEQGDWLAAFVTMRAVALDSGRMVHVSAMSLVRFEGGRVAEAYNTFDFMDFFEQVGLLPANALELCLTGTRLG